MTHALARRLSPRRKRIWIPGVLILLVTMSQAVEFHRVEEQVKDARSREEYDRILAHDHLFSQPIRVVLLSLALAFVVYVAIWAVTARLIRSIKTRAEEP